MRRLAGNLLMGLGILGAALTLIWIVGGIVVTPHDANEDQRTMRDAGILMAGAMLAVEVVVFLIGRSLRRSETNAATPEAKHRSRRRRWLLIPYLAGSLGIGALAAFLPRSAYEAIEPLGLLICQPYILVHFIGGGLLGIKLSEGGMTHIVTVAANFVYFPILLYPLYRILTMDRKVEAKTYTLMKTALGLFLGAHILIALFLVIASQA